jgi:hypothetical protein
MSRPLRIDYPNAWHHVMNRARRRYDLFIDKADYQHQYSSVSSTVIRVKKMLQKDRKFKDRLQYIESNILKGQT